VCLGEQRLFVGVLHFNAQGNRRAASFSYSDEWLRRTDGFQLDPALPLVTGVQHSVARSATVRTVFFGCIADTQPDGWGRTVIKRAHAKRRREAKASGRSYLTEPLNDLDYLLEVDDASRVGALRFQEGQGPFLRHTPPGERAAPPLVELSMLLNASRAIEENSETSSDLRYLQGRGTSLGGMRRKCTVVDDEGRLSIGKFPSVADERSVTKGEVLALRLATRAGIRAADAQIVYADRNPVALVRRFDRSPRGRLMYVSARTLVGAKDDQDHTYTEIVDAIRQFGARASEDIRELWRRMVYNILINNVDDHLNNHGFLHQASGAWRLSPAFDINPFPDKARSLKTWISEDSGDAASIANALGVAPYFGLKAPEALSILKEVSDAVSSWREVALQPEVGMSKADIDDFEPAFEYPRE
jgi:serine/threonine-protein kinase HipA